MDLEQTYISLIHAVFDELAYCSNGMPKSYQIEAIKSALEVMRESEVFTVLPPKNLIVAQNKILHVSHFLNCSIAIKNQFNPLYFQTACNYLETALSLLTKE